MKERLKRIDPLVWLIRQCRRLARPGRFLVWHTPHEPFRSELIARMRGQMGGSFLEVASGHQRLAEDFVNLDLNLGPQVDVLGNAGELPFVENAFALVWLEAALEHLPEPQLAVQEIHRVLKPGGRVYVEVPFMQGYHADPGDYQRYTMEGLRRLFQNFSIEQVEAVCGPASSFCYMGTSLLASLFSFGSSWLYKIGFHYVFCYFFYPIKFLDRLIIHQPEAHRTSFGYMLLALKSPGSKSEPGAAG